MAYLILPNQSPAPISKDYFSVGFGPQYDVDAGSGPEHILFTVCRKGDGYEVIPGVGSVLLNGKPLKKRSPLNACDRLDWKEGCCNFQSEVSTSSNASVDHSMEIIKRLDQQLEVNSNPIEALEEAFIEIVELSGAESGYLLTENEDESEWKIRIAMNKDRSRLAVSRTKDLVSNTILSEALTTKEPVVVESLVNHPWSEQASIIASELYSVACLPVFLGARPVGVFYLYTNTPGMGIKGDRLRSLSAVGTHLALLVNWCSQLKKQKRRKSSTNKIIYAPEGAMALALSRTTKLARTDLNLLVIGESGTGKEVVANEVHRKSSRSEKPFVSINCAAIPPTLIESTLFGVVKGAYTGAERDRAGKIQQANGGTLFLDEIGDLSFDLQAKLLRAIQEKVVEPVGSDKSIKVNFRIVAATHQDLGKLVSEQKFREDLFFRLNGATIQLPPLRDRREDIEPLALEFLSQVSPGGSITKEAIEALRNYDWPGNIRELQQVVMRAVALSGSDAVDEEALEFDSPLSKQKGASSLLPLKEAQAAFTREYVMRSLDRFGGSRVKAAKHLGISERTLYRLLASDSADILN